MKGRIWSQEDDETIIRMIGLGKSRTEIAVHFGVTKNSIIGRAKRLRDGPQDPKYGPRKPRKAAVWTEDMKMRLRNQLIEMTEAEILKQLALGGSHTASEIRVSIMNEAGGAYVWDALQAMQRAGLVWRRHDTEHEFDWRLAHHWQITGCGRIFAYTVSSKD